MKEISQSATKIVFILMAVAVVAMTFMGIITSEQFMPLITMVFMAYYKTPPASSKE